MPSVTIDPELTIKRLRELAACKPGHPIPVWMGVNDWGVALSELARDAADLIEGKPDDLSNG